MRKLLLMIVALLFVSCSRTETEDIRVFWIELDGIRYCSLGGYTNNGASSYFSVHYDLAKTLKKGNTYTFKVKRTPTYNRILSLEN